MWIFDVFFGSEASYADHADGRQKSHLPPNDFFSLDRSEFTSESPPRPEMVRFDRHRKTNIASQFSHQLTAHFELFQSLNGFGMFCFHHNQVLFCIVGCLKMNTSVHNRVIVSSD